MDTHTSEVHKASTPAQINAEDKYTASIELSNKCREFYKSRVEAAHCIKSKWEKDFKEAAHQSNLRNDNDRPAVHHAGSSSSSNSNSGTTQRRKKSSIDEAMDKLRTEMSSLMDQDLSLMKQLLTLNETIEDLKWQRRYYSSPRTSADLDESDCSISDTEMYESEDELRVFSSVTATATTTTTTTATIPSTSCRRHSVSHKGEKRCSESPVMVMGESSVKVYHGEQDSFDSGIHESCSGSSSSEEEAVLEASI